MAHDHGDERLHDQLWRAVQKLPGHYAPHGEVDRGDPSLPSCGPLLDLYGPGAWGRTRWDE